MHDLETIIKLNAEGQTKPIMKGTAIMTRWLIMPTTSGMALFGDVKADSAERFKDGTAVTTSNILEVDALAGTVTTQNTIYKLDNIG